MSKVKSIGAPDSTLADGFSINATFSATGGSMLITNGEPGTSFPCHFTFTWYTSSSGGANDTVYLFFSSGFGWTSQGTSPTFSPLQDTSNLPKPASLVSRFKHTGVSDSTEAGGISTTFTLPAAFSNKLTLNGLPFTCLPLHITLSSYKSGSGGVKDTLYILSCFCFTATGT